MKVRFKLNYIFCFLIIINQLLMMINKQTSRVHGMFSNKQGCLSPTLILKRRISSSPYFVKYLGIINQNNFNKQYFIIYKPIKLGDPHSSIYKICRHFLPFIISKKQLKKHPQYCKDVFQYLTFCQEKLKTQIRRWLSQPQSKKSKIRSPDQLLRRQLFQNQYVESLTTNAGINMYKDFQKVCSSHKKLKKTQYHKMFEVNLEDVVNYKDAQEKHFQKEQKSSNLDQTQKDQINNYYSNYYLNYLKQNIEVKISFRKIQQLTILSSQLPFVAFFTGTSTNLKQAYIAQKFPYPQSLQKVKQQFLQQQADRILKNQLSVQRIFILNYYKNVQKIQSQLKKLIAYPLKELTRNYHQLKLYSYQYHPKYQMFNNGIINSPTIYRLAPDPLYLRALGIHKQPLNEMEQIIEGTCKPHIDIYRLIDEYFQLQDRQAQFQQTSQKNNSDKKKKYIQGLKEFSQKFTMVRQRQFKNIVKFAFVVSQFKHINYKLLAEILGSSRQKQFELIDKFIKQVFLRYYYQPNQQYENQQKYYTVQNEIFCQYNFYHAIQRLISLKVDEVFQTQMLTLSAYDKAQQQNKNNKKNQQYKRKTYFPQIAISYQNISNFYDTKPPDSQNPNYSADQDGIYIYYLQYKSCFKFLTDKTNQWLEIQLKKINKQQQQFTQKTLQFTDAKLLNSFMIYLLNYIYILNFQLYFMEYYPEETFKKKKKYIRSQRQQMYYVRQSNMKEILKNIQNLKSKFKSSKEFQKLKNQYSQFFSIIQENKKIRKQNKYQTQKIIQDINFDGNQPQKNFIFELKYLKQLKKAKQHTQQIYRNVLKTFRNIKIMYFKKRCLFINETNQHLNKAQINQIDAYFQIFFRFCGNSFSQFSQFLNYNFQQQQSKTKNQKQKIIVSNPKNGDDQIQKQIMEKTKNKIQEFQIGGTLKKEHKIKFSHRQL